MAFVSSFSGASITTSSQFVPCTSPIDKRSAAQSGTANNEAGASKLVALFTPDVDEFMARSVHAQYVQKACPSGVPPIQCIEGVTANETQEVRTLKRQSELRYYQLPTSVKVHNFYEIRKAALIQAHGCSHEENRVLKYPKMAIAYLIGNAEADKACSRYFKQPAINSPEYAMKRSVDNMYQQAVNGSGVFSVACTDGQAKYEAYLNQVRGKSTQFRANQYSQYEKESMKFKSAKQALTQKGHDCTYEESIFTKYPIVSASMRPTFGYYPPFVTNPSYGLTSGVSRPQFAPSVLTAIGVAANVNFGYPVAK